ncbi:hypothetical protein ACFQX6_50270 [Streptosporangium lutulentum]
MGVTAVPIPAGGAVPILTSSSVSAGQSDAETPTTEITRPSASAQETRSNLAPSRLTQAPFRQAITVDAAPAVSAAMGPGPPSPPMNALAAASATTAATIVMTSADTAFPREPCSPTKPPPCSHEYSE